METQASLFWNIYARSYDGLLKIIPYQRLAERVADSVPAEARTLLDAGCGTGNLLQVMVGRHPRMTVEGIDRSPAMLARARTKLETARLTLGDLNRKLPYAAGTFDVVTCVNALYAVADVEGTLRELRRVLKPGGTLIVTSPLPRAGIWPLIVEHASAAGWVGTVPLLARLTILLVLNVLILHQRTLFRFHFLEMSAVQQLFNNAPVLLAYAGQNWFVRFTKPDGPRQRGFEPLEKSQTNIHDPFRS